VAELVIALPEWSRNYHSVIQRPMDFGTVARSLQDGKYTSTAAVCA
jgi:hypothetical protein